MKNWSFALLLIAVFASCKNDFQVTADWKSVPVVYGLLNGDSSIQYIKLEKVFVDQKLSAYTMSQNPDSLYYPKDTKVTILGYDSYNNLHSTINFELVDGDTIPGFQKDAVVFASSPNLFYRYKGKLTDSIYKLEIRKADGSLIASATTGITRKPTFIQPNEVQTNVTLSFVKPNTVPANQIVYKFNSALYGKVYDVVVRLNYYEVNKVSKDTTYKFIDWTPVSGIVSSNELNRYGETLDATFDGLNFYSFLRTKLKADANIERHTRNLDLMLYSGNGLFNTYMQVAYAQSGFTSGSVQPEYTNIVGGLGLFASRHLKVRRGYKLNPVSLDSLRRGTKTAALGFVE